MCHVDTKNSLLVEQNTERSGTRRPLPTKTAFPAWDRTRDKAYYRYPYLAILNIDILILYDNTYSNLCKVQCTNDIYTSDSNHSNNYFITVQVECKLHCLSTPNLVQCAA